MQQLQAALAVKLDVLGLEHTSTGDTYHCIGHVLSDQGKCAEAMQQFQTALEIKLNALGPEHVSLQQPITVLGMS